MIKQNSRFTIWENIIQRLLRPTVCGYSYHSLKDSITIGEAQKMKNGIIETNTQAYLPKAFRPVAKIGANIVIEVCVSNWPFWNQASDTVMQLKKWLKILPESCRNPYKYR